MNATPLMPGQRLLVRKRPRHVEDEGSELANSAYAGFGEHRSKRLNCQPLPETVSDGSASASDGFQFTSTANITLATEPLYSNAEQFVHQDNQNAFSSHIPTPIDTTFPSQHRSWSGPGPAISYLNGSRQVSTEHEIMAGHSADDISIPRTIEPDSSWPHVQNQYLARSGLPSPESGFDSTMEDSPDVDMDYEQSPDREFPPQMQVPVLQEPCSPPQDTNSSPSWKGHNRSRHTVNSWTWQPGMKRSFSIGYCSDCEKCQSKVPGHFNHIVI